MRTTLGTTQRAALALGSATTLALLGLASPAAAAPSHHAAPHHSASAHHDGNQGQDRRATSLKDGRGHNPDWQAQADPDGDENGGVDQPGGTGGVGGSAT